MLNDYVICRSILIALCNSYAIRVLALSALRNTHPTYRGGLSALCNGYASAQMIFTDKLNNYTSN